MPMTISLVCGIAAAAGLLLAQGPRGPQGGIHGGTGLNMAKVQTIEGAITSIDMGYGMQYPSIVVNKAVIKTAPVWFFLENDFELKTGDKVRVTAAPSLAAGDSYLYAVEIAKTGGTVLKLRDAAGVPVWTGGPAERQGQGPGAGVGAGDCGCLDAAAVQTVSGTVQKVSAGIGIQMPSITLKPAAGDLIEIKIGPEAVLLAADFEIKAGDTLTAKVAFVSCADEYVALELTNAAGKTVVLRGDDGTPGWNR
jgi:hypothetical protein